jgi:hypothetical protein
MSRDNKRPIIWASRTSGCYGDGVPRADSERYTPITIGRHVASLHGVPEEASHLGQAEQCSAAKPP